MKRVVYAALILCIVCFKSRDTCDALELFVDGGCQLVIGSFGCGEFSNDELWRVASNPNGDGGLWGSKFESDQLFLVHSFPGSGLPIDTFPLNFTERLIGFAIDPTDGTFYGQTLSSLVSLDPESGEVETIGDFDDDFNLRPTRFSNTLAFDARGGLFAANQGSFQSGILQIDKTSADAVLLGIIDTRVQGLAFHPDTDELFAYTYGAVPAGTSYGVSQLKLDLLTSQFIGAAPGRRSGLAFVSVPEPNSSFVILSVAFALMLALRRDR